MPSIVKLLQSRRLPGYCRMTLSCGHTLMQTQDALRQLGDILDCEACTNNEREIRGIRFDHGQDTCQIQLSCGHIRTGRFTGPITYCSVGEFVGTMMPCAQCRDDS